MEDKNKNQAKKDSKYLDYIPDENDDEEALDDRLQKIGRKNQALSGITGSKDIIEETKLDGPN